MEIREFVSRALTEVLNGVKDAQGSDDGPLVNAAHGKATEMGGNLYQAQFGVFTRVDFDLAVTAESKIEGGGQAKLTVVGIGFGANGATVSSTQSVSRMAFSVPIQIPDGDQSRLEAHRKAQEETARKIRDANRNRSSGGF